MIDDMNPEMGSVFVKQSGRFLILAINAINEVVCLKTKSKTFLTRYRKWVKMQKPLSNMI